MIKAIYILFFIFSVIGVFGLIVPLAKDIMEKREDIKYHQRVIKANDKYISEVKDLIDKRESYSEDMQRVDKMTPENPEIPALFNFIEQTARENKMRIERLGDFSVINSERNQFFGAVSFSFTLQGNYGSFKEFLSMVEENERLIEINRLSIEEEYWKNNFHINASAYYYKE